MAVWPSPETQRKSVFHKGESVVKQGRKMRTFELSDIGWFSIQPSVFGDELDPVSGALLSRRTACLTFQRCLLRAW